MDALVLESHDEGPCRVIELDGKGPVALHNDVYDNTIYYSAVLGDSAGVRPFHFIFGQVVPRHFVYACFHDLFKFRIHWILYQPSKAQLVDVKGCNVAVVENKRMPQLMPRTTNEYFATLFQKKTQKYI
jgi:hypothetical protein